MRDALVREKSKKGGEETVTVERKNSKQYHRSTQSPSKTQELTDTEVKKWEEEEELHVQMKRVVQIKIRQKTINREGIWQKRRDLAIPQQKHILMWERPHLPVYQLKKKNTQKISGVKKPDAHDATLSKHNFDMLERAAHQQPETNPFCDPDLGF